jgi:uncharacterized protein YdhG (YjbR/CyaY superfamily)
MATSRPTVTAYLARQPPRTRALLRQVREVIRRRLPDAEELVSYQMPAYRVDGLIALYFAAWTAHWSLYPVSAALAAALGPLPKGCEVRKSTLRVALEVRVPVRLIERFVSLRVKELTERKARRAPRRG